MNKIFGNIIICALAALTFSACEKDRGCTYNGATLNLDLRVASCVTKTTGSATIEDTPEEANIDIDKLRIFLVPADSEGEPVATSAVMEISNSDITEEDGEIKVFLSPAYRGSWLLFVVANCPSGLDIKTNSYADFIGAYEYAATGIADLWTDGSFMMVNRQNETDGCAGVLVTLDDRDTDLTVYLERISVKIVARDADMIDFAPYHTVVVGSDVTYAISSATIEKVALLNCVNTFYLTQRWAEPVTGEQNLVSPSSSLGYSMSDGYYYNHPNGTSADLQWVDLGTPMYCLENNSPLYKDFTFTDPALLEKQSFAVDGTKMKGRVTGLVFKAQFKVASGFTSGLVTDPVDPDDDDPGIWTKAGSSDEEAKTLYKYKSIYFVDTDAILAKFASDFIGVDMTDFAQLRSKGVNIYEDGYVYYTYWITDPNYRYKDGANESGDDIYRNQISIARNTLYELTVTNISAFGDEYPCTAEYNPEHPLGTKAPKLSVSIKIKDWDDKDYHYNL